MSEKTELTYEAILASADDMQGFLHLSPTEVLPLLANQIAEEVDAFIRVAMPGVEPLKGSDKRANLLANLSTCISAKTAEHELWSVIIRVFDICSGTWERGKHPTP